MDFSQSFGLKIPIDNADTCCILEAQAFGKRLSQDIFL